MKKNNNKGFTLVEVLGAIVILGILMGIAVASYSVYRDKANTTSYELIEKNAISAAEEYFIDNVNEDEVTLNKLVNESYMEPVIDPASRNDTCTGKVSIIEKTKKGEKSLDKNTYMVKLECKVHNSCHIEPGTLSCTPNDGITTDGKKTYYDTGVVNTNIPRDEVTYAIRLKFNEFRKDSNMEYFGNWESGGGGLGLFSSTNVFYFSIKPQGKEYINISSHIAAKKDTWYIVVGTYSNGTARLYLNGELVASKLMTGPVQASNANVIVGGNPQIGGDPIYQTSVSVKDILVLSKGIDKSTIGPFIDPNKSINYTGEGIVFKKSF